LLAHAIGQTATLLLQIVRHPRPLAQLYDDRIVDRQATKRMPIGSQAVRHHMCVTPIVFGTGDGEAIPAAIELLRIDRIDLKASLQQRLDYRPVRHLNGDSHHLPLVGSRDGHHWLAASGHDLHRMLCRRRQ
jgi:hypothetical protein